MATTKRNKKLTIKLTTKLTSIDEVKAKAMKDVKFFKALVNNPDVVLNSAEIELSEKDKAIIYLLVKFGTCPVTADQLLQPFKDIVVRGVWVS